MLIGVDPEGGTLHYSISGPVFSVDRDTGVVRLRQQLDRETQDLVEVIISITGKLLIFSRTHIAIFQCCRNEINHERKCSRNCNLSNLIE